MYVGKYVYLLLACYNLHPWQETSFHYQFDKGLLNGYMQDIYLSSVNAILSSDLAHGQNVSSRAHIVQQLKQNKDKK